jgi:putative hydrolase of the HAD superfamily
MTRAIFFDAVGTLFHLPLGVGHHYAVAGALIGAKLDPTALDRAFREVYPEMPQRPATGQPREDDDKGWWRELVRRVLLRVPHRMSELDQDSFFEAAYEHFAEAGVWELYPEVLETLEKLQVSLPLFVVSNFDGRLRVILERLGISRVFKAVFVSSEVGADKPDPLLFQLAAQYAGFPPTEILHVGDDPIRDWRAAAEAGLSVFELSRPLNSLRDVAATLNRLA